MDCVSRLECELCNLHRPPFQVPKSNIKQDKEFNQRLLADTVWIHLPGVSERDAGRPVPVLSLVDAGTKFMAARVLQSEQALDFIQALERAWLRHFGPPGTLQVDDARIIFARGPATTASSWRRRRGRHTPGCRWWNDDTRCYDVPWRSMENPLPGAADRDRIIYALCYVAPQINNRPNLWGFSATQWALGYEPRMPGVLMDEDLTIAQLTPSETMAQKLHLKAAASIAVTKADNDARLRRALLRQHMEQQYVYSTGQRIFYWRDAPDPSSDGEDRRQSSWWSQAGQGPTPASTGWLMVPRSSGLRPSICAHLKKQKPISFPEEGETRPVTERERSSLRALIGGLQWPATQTSPHLQAMISTLAGRVKDATTETLREANKILRFAKHHSDVRLQFRPLGEPQNLTFMIYSDAAFASRQDLSSQGGYLLILVHKDVRMGSEGYYNVVDWRSWKLPRVARSSLSAESQAASEAADTLLYTCTFWRLLWMPYLDLEAVSTARLHCAPCLIIDAKALYDLLSRLEASSPGGADKRTAIEVLVTQDKLRCAQAQTLWVSSELQFSDGLTKDSAAQLLAERLHTHMTRVKPDPNFQAAKRKDPVARKAGAEAYAQKRPTRALQAAVLAAGAGVHSYVLDTFEYLEVNTNVLVWDWSPPLSVIYVLMIVIALAFLVVTIRDYQAKPTMMPLRHDREQQTDDYNDSPEVMPEPAVEEDVPSGRSLTPERCRRREEHLRHSLWQFDRKIQDQALLIRSLQGVMRPTLEEHVEQHALTLACDAIRRNLWFTPHGECWHASELCAGRSARAIEERRPCKLCCEHYVRAIAQTSRQSSSSSSA